MQDQGGRQGTYATGMTGIARVVGLLREGDGPRMVRDTVGTVRRYVRTVRRVDGVAGRVRMLRLIGESVLSREVDQPGASSAVPLTVSQVSPRPLWLRPRSRDRAAFEFLDGRHHIPPPELVDPPKHIAIFGANIGLLAADLAMLYPEARLLGVEPDPGNAAVARRNLAHLRDRCELVEKAVWWRDEELDVTPTRGAWGLNVRVGPADQALGVRRTVQAVDAAALLDDFTGGAAVDYLLVNVESAWHEMLRHGDWTQNVRCIKIEIEDHYDEAEHLLREQGYRTRLERLCWGAFVVGIRP